jgi:lambda family phage tail tape measure protein
MANFIGRLGVLLGLDSAEFQKGIQQASRQLDSFVEKARTTAAVGATAFAAMAYQAMKLADEIVDTAKANDIAVDSVLKLRNALALSGGEAENAGKFLSSFTATIDKAAEGSFETQKTFKTLGVSLDDLRKMNIDELFTKTVNSLSNMSDPLTRNAKAMELFGKAAKGVDFVALNEELKNGAGVTNAQAKAIEDAAATYDLLAKAARDVSVTIASELGPPLKATIDYFKDIKSQGNLLADGLKVSFQTVAVVLSDVAFVIGGIYRQTMQTLLIFKSVIPGTNVEGQFSKYLDEAEKERAKLDEFQRRIMGGGGGRGGGVSDFDDPRRLDRKTEKPDGAPQREVKKGIDKEAEAAKKKADDEAKKRQELIARGAAEEMRQREETSRFLAEQETMYQRGNAALIDRQQLASIEIDRTKEMLELVFQGRNMRGEDLQLAQELKTIEWSRLDAIREINANETLTREARASAIERENAMAEKSVELARTRLDLTRQTRTGSLSEGFSNALETMGRNAATDFERGQQAFQSVLGNMESAIDRFVKTGKLSFKDLARSIITDMIAIQMKAAALRFLGGIFSSMSGGGTTMSQFEYASISGYADGGEPPVGRASIVGERGPEIFVPKTAGTIIPNHALGNMGSTTNVTNNYINAIDTKSFEDRLLGSSNAIWAANQYANKGLAVNRGRA